MANTGSKEIEQRDMNPNSPTFNQVRWVAGGEDLTLCPLPNTAAVWVATGATRCQVANSENTGFVELAEQDTNSQSPTFNQVRWVQGNYNSTQCPVTNPEYFLAGAFLRETQPSAPDACAYTSTLVTNAYTPTGAFTVGAEVKHYLIKPDGTEDETGTPAFEFADGYYKVSGSSQVVQITAGKIAAVSSC